MTTTTAQLVIDERYSFDLYPSTFYGQQLNDVLFKGSFSADLAVMFGIRPEEEHRKVYNTLPDGTIDDATKYNWLSFETISGTQVILGAPWIKEETITGGLSTNEYQVNIVGDVGLPERVRLALNKIGEFEFSIKSV